MTNSTKILIFHVSAGGGHKAAARAIAEAGEARGFSCEVVDALDLTPPWFARAYVGTHLRSTEHTPALYGQGYAALDQRRAWLDGLRGVFDRAVGARLVDEVRRVAPAAVIATHFFPMAVLGQARLGGAMRAPLAGVVTDYAAHAFWAEPGVDRFCVAPGRAARDLVRHGIAPEQIVATGIPIRPAFGAIPALRVPAPGEPLRVLITSGGFGVGPMVEILRSFAGIPDMELTVICGDNAERVEQAREAAAEVGLRAEIVGFERDMPRRMAEAHVLVGKPGGLTSSEALAAGRPMVLVGACPGQELCNQSWLLDHGAALASSPALAGLTVASLRDEGTLPTLAQAARALGAPRAARRVIDVALRLMDAPREAWMPLAA